MFPTRPDPPNVQYLKRAQQHLLSAFSSTHSASLRTQIANLSLQVGSLAQRIRSAAPCLSHTRSLFPPPCPPRSRPCHK